MTVIQRTNSWTRRNRERSLSKKIDDPMGPAAIVADIPRDIEADYRRVKTKKGSSCCSMSRLMLLVIFILVAGYAYVYYHERDMLKSQLIEQETTMRELEINLSMKFDEKVKKMASENDKLKESVDALKSEKIKGQNLKDQYHLLQAQVEKRDSDLKQKLEVEKRLQRQKTTLETNIQKMSKAAALEKFGPGPYTVEIHAKLDTHDKNKVDQGWILLELAPLDTMPHTVYWFLEQVSRGLYDGGSFHRNAGHVIQAGMVSNFLTDPKKPVNKEKFQSTGFDKIMFPEYSPDFPHAKYTLGYAGRPGGPDFYINMKNNTKSHGPGGQGHPDDPTEADSCFAKVKKGFDLVDRIAKLPIKDGSNKALKDNVAIVSMKILKYPKP